jgi:Plasmid encoded RepA protein
MTPTYRVEKQNYSHGAWRVLDTEGRQVWRDEVFDHPTLGRWSEAGFRIASGADLWWDPKAPNQAALWQSKVTLSPDFFAEIVRRPVPVDMAALRALRRSPLALDF